jgi:hypothetical protein
LYVYKTWSLALRKEHILKVFDNRALSRIFGPKRQEVAGGYRRMQSEELHNLNGSPYISSVIRSRKVILAECVARMGKKRNVYKTKSEGKSVLGRHRCRW